MLTYSFCRILRFYFITTYIIDRINVYAYDNKELVERGQKELDAYLYDDISEEVNEGE